MIQNIDLLAIPCAEYCEHNGVKGVFIPEVPNFRYSAPEGGIVKRGGPPARAIIRMILYKAIRKKQKYDYMGRMIVYPEYQEAYLANPNTVNRKRYMAYGYNFVPGQDETPGRVSDAGAFEKLLED